ncbi:MAG: glycosyltransferase [Cytophagaceae bacterium]
MIKGETFVCLALNTWESDHMNTLVQMMTVLSKENKVLYVDYQYTYKDLISAMGGGRKLPLRKVAGLEDRLTRIETKYGSEVHVLNVPPIFPYNWVKNIPIYDRVLSLNAHLIKDTISKALKSMCMTEPIVISGYNPFFGLKLAGEFNEKLNVYYCYDEIKGDQWYNFHGPRIEQEYMKKTDLVITTSDALYESKSDFHGNCYVVKNGVDFNLFNQVAWERPLNREKKVVGYTGSIDERFHTNMVVHAVQNLPETEFLFVGRVTNHSAAAAISRFPNVKLLGSRKPEEIPGFIKDIDVGIIPYLKNEVTKGVYPLKINEYLAAGCSVVMSNFANLSDFKDLISVAGTKEEFLNSITKELANDNEEQRRARIHLASSNSWEHRVEEFSQILLAKLSMKKQADHVRSA